jgi:hypothetical protein
MKKSFILALAGVGMLLTPIAALAAQVAEPIVVAQDLDVQVGPGGVRIGGDRDRERGERFRDRDRDVRDRFERREFRGDGDRYRSRRFVERRDRCRTVIIRRETESGTRIRRIRRCG